MAKLKIYQSELAVKTPKVPDLQGLTLPFNITHEQGEAFKSFFKDVSDIRKVRKATQNQNDARKLTLEIDKDIKKKHDSYLNSTNEDDYDTFVKSISLKNYQPLIKGYNKDVRALVGNHIFKAQSDLGPKLYGKILANHITETKNGHLNVDLKRIGKLLSSNDEDTIKKGERELESFSTNIAIRSHYLPSEFDELIKSTLKNAREESIFNEARNQGATNIAERGQEITKEFGSKRRDIILNKVNNIALSKQLSKDLHEEKLIEATENQQITNYQTVLERLLNKDDPDYESIIPTFDDINDMWKAGSLNSDQYFSLFDYYVNGEVKGGNQEVINAVLYQVGIANQVEDLDKIQREVHFNPEWVANLSLDEKKTFAAAFKAIKQNRPIWSDYKYYKTQIDNTMGNVQEWVSKYDKNRAEELMIATSAAMDYEKHIANGMRPDDAYISVLKQYAGEDRLPTIYHLPQLQNYSVAQLKKAELKDPVNLFQNIEDELAALAADEKITMQSFREDISRLDVMKDLNNLHNKIKDKNTGEKFKGTDAG